MVQKLLQRQLTVDYDITNESYDGMVGWLQFQHVCVFPLIFWVSLYFTPDPECLTVYPVDHFMVETKTIPTEVFRTLETIHLLRNRGGGQKTVCTRYVLCEQSIISTSKKYIKFQFLARLIYFRCLSIMCSKIIINSHG